MVGRWRTPTVYGRSGEPTGERRVDGHSRGEICDAYKERVVLVARRIFDRLPSECELELEDLVSLGAIGLLEAFDHFEADRNILFSTFAEYRIRGAMMDGLRQSDAFTRYRRQLSRRLAHAEQELLVELGRRPEPREVAERLDMSLDAYFHARDTTQPVSHTAIDAREESGPGDEARALVDVLVGSYGDEAYQAILGRQARRLLRQAIRELPERKRQCVLLYYGRGLTLSEIAKVFDLTPSRISQILSSSRKELRENLEGLVDPLDISFYEDAPEAEAL
jgi:RNA polymerase sigma factor for flagellar operon FliA